MFDQTRQEIALLYSEQLQTMEDFNTPRDTVRLFKNRMARLCPEDQLLVLQAHNPFNPSDCMDVADAL